MTRFPLPSLSLALVAACAAPREAELVASRARAAAPRAPAVTVEVPAAVTPAPEPSVATPVPAAAPAPAPRTDDLTYWQDPDFRRRLAESYVAETETEPDLTELERESLPEVFDRIGAGKLEEARVLLEKQRTPSSSAQVDFILGNLNFQQDRLEPAVAAYRVAVQKHPRFRRAWSNLGLCCARQGQYREAAEAFARLIELGGGSAADYGILGIAYTNLGDWLAAESAFRMAALLEPGRDDWKMGMAEALFRQERFAETVALTKGMIAAKPERSELWMLQANAFARMQRPLEAAQNLEMVDRLGKSTPESLFLLGDIYTNEELFDLAADTYLRAFDAGTSPRPERALRAAQGLGVRGANEETTRLVARIQERFGAELGDEQRRDLLHLRVRVAMATGAGDEEAAVLEEIVSLDPLDGRALLLLGQHEARADHPEKAVFWFERAAQIEAVEADARIAHAQLLVKQNQYAEALPLLRRAQSLQPRENVQQFLERVERAAQGR